MSAAGVRNITRMGQYHFLYLRIAQFFIWQGTLQLGSQNQFYIINLCIY